MSECTQELLAPLTDAVWREALVSRLQSSASFMAGGREIGQICCNKRRSYTIYPPVQHTFSALLLTPLDQVRVVIVGQDPYHGPGQAHGLCFLVLPGQALPPSLKNMYAKLQANPQVTTFPSAPPCHGHLVRWAQQGVLLLNTVLSVQQGQANAHQKQGWEVVTDVILQ